MCSRRTATGRILPHRLYRSAKGVCIVLVVFNHCGFQLTDRFYLLQHLRMPLYFFISGLFFRDYGGLAKTMLRKADRLLLPLALFTAIAIATGAVVRISRGEPLVMSDYISDGQIHVTGLWFLLCLFWQSMICHALVTSVKPAWARIGITALIGGCGILLAHTVATFPLHIDSALTTFPFYYFGYSMKGAAMLTSQREPTREIPIALLLLLTACAIGFLNDSGTIAYYVNQYSGSAIMSLLQSAAMVIAALLLLKQIGRLPILSYVGRFSLIVLGLHGIVSSVVITLGDMAGIGLTPATLSLAVLTLSALCIEPLRRLLPHFTAQRNLLSRGI